MFHPTFTVEPWSVTESELDLDILARTESCFALSNGHIGMRGNLDEGEPYGLPGTYLNSVYELRPLPYAEAGYGYPESGQTVVNVTNGKLIRLLVNGDPFDVRYGRLLSHRRVLDLRAGVLRRDVEWRSQSGARLRVSSIRLVSLVERAVAAIFYEVEALDTPIRVVVQSELVANEALPRRPTEDPRVSAILEKPLVGEEAMTSGSGGVLVHHVRRSGLRLAAAMDHELDAPQDFETAVESAPDIARFSVIGTLEPSQKLSLTKFLGYGWSAHRSRPALHDQARGALMVAKHTGWDGLLAVQRQFLDEFWGGFDVEIDGDPDVQQAVRFSIFHVLQAGAKAGGRPIPAKGLTGPGYDGHAFWDTEIYVLGLLSLSRPESVADALRWRHSTLPLARKRANELGFSGAAFPWRTINGEECSAYWPAGTAAFHVSADIAYAVISYMRATGDQSFLEEFGLELLVETARLWRSIGHYHMDGSFRIDGVTGPDEYSAISDNNIYTNLMAQLNLEAAAQSCAANPERASALGVGDEETASWLDAARDMHVPFDERLGVHPQADRFTHHQAWDFAQTKPDQYPLMLHFSYFDLYRKQVVKQADLVLAMFLRGDAFTLEQKTRNFDYYEGITVRDSSLSASIQAVIAAETGYLRLAYDYIGESSLVDLTDLEHNTTDGLHMASLAGAWAAVVDGLGGVRVEDSRLIFRPRLPESLRGVRFGLRYRGQRLEVDVRSDRVCYRLVEGDGLSIWHYDKEVLLKTGADKHRDIPPLESRPPPHQPPGREPRRRGTR